MTDEEAVALLPRLRAELERYRLTAVLNLRCQASGSLTARMRAYVARRADDLEARPLHEMRAAYMADRMARGVSLDELVAMVPGMVRLG